MGGFESWASAHFDHLYLDGVQMKAEGSIPAEWQSPVDRRAGVAVDGSDVLALQLADDAQAVTSLGKIGLDFELWLETEEHRQNLGRALAKTAAAKTSAIYWGAWVQEGWRLEVTGQTAWNTSRGTAWGLTGVTSGSHPALATIETAAGVVSSLTVVGSAGPATGELYVPGGAAPFAVESNADLVASAPGGMLYLWYPMRAHGFLSVDWEVRGSNDYRAGVTFEEAR